MVSILLVPNLHFFINIIQYPVLLQVNIEIPVQSWSGCRKWNL